VHAALAWFTGAVSTDLRGLPWAAADSGTAGAEPPPVGPLVSGEAVELEVRVARIGSRVLALLLDIMVQISLFALLLLAGTLLITFTMSSAADRALYQAVGIGVLVAVLVGYPTVSETLTNGRTIGKLALGLRVVRDDGGPIRFRHAFTRGLVGAAVDWPGMIMPLLTWVVSIGTMLSNPQSKRLGDLAAGTIVVHERTPASWGWVPAMPPALAGWASVLDLTGLDDELALAVRHFLARNREIAEPARSRLGYTLAVEVARCTTPPPPPGVPGWAYLAAVLAERHRRAAQRLAAARAATAALWPGFSAPRPLLAAPSAAVAVLPPPPVTLPPVMLRPSAPR
jgi:uncharacterized RDD family membrane protein YckC